MNTRNEVMFTPLGEGKERQSRVIQRCYMVQCGTQQHSTASLQELAKSLQLLCSWLGIQYGIRGNGAHPSFDVGFW